MPRKPINYDNTIFYKLVCKDTNVKECYVGHTTEFTNRKCSHKGRCTNPNNVKYNYRIYQIIRENGGWDNWDMVMIEQRSCANLMEATKIERQHYESSQLPVNNNIPAGTLEEWREANKNKQFGKMTCACGGVCAYKHKKRHERSLRHIEYLNQNSL